MSTTGISKLNSNHFEDCIYIMYEVLRRAGSVTKDWCIITAMDYLPESTKRSMLSSSYEVSAKGRLIATPLALPHTLAPH